MARVYKPPVIEKDTGLEGQGVRKLDPESRHGFFQFWIAAASVLVSAIVLFVVAREIPNSGLSATGSVILAVCAAVAIVGLLLMYNAMRRMRIVSKSELNAGDRVESLLEQLDNRFSIFHDVREGEVWIDHVVVGPSGVFVIKSTPAASGQTTIRPSEARQATDGAEVVEKLARRLEPGANLGVSPVVCVAGANEAHEIDREGEVWVVPARRLVASILKRSSTPGAITNGVVDTGAFANDIVRAAALEKALVKHWNVPREKTLDDYRPRG
ncbi:MAG: NERD domain-containing protein [Candidatus Sumerlaeaceae bacterium]|nr:NERD domain-containing protein [Candidatus Sumerlaeaceae bacterium]